MLLNNKKEINYGISQNNYAERPDPKNTYCANTFI